MVRSDPLVWAEIMPFVSIEKMGEPVPISRCGDWKEKSGGNCEWSFRRGDDSKKEGIDRTLL